MTRYDNAPYIDCPGCTGTLARAGCAIHGGWKSGPPGMAPVLHHHHWVLDQATEWAAIYHCDAHDPPLVRVVRIGGAP